MQKQQQKIPHKIPTKTTQINKQTKTHKQNYLLKSKMMFVNLQYNLWSEQNIHNN